MLQQIVTSPGTVVLKYLLDPIREILQAVSPAQDCPRRRSGSGGDISALGSTTCSHGEDELCHRGGRGAPGLQAAALLGKERVVFNTSNKLNFKQAIPPSFTPSGKGGTRADTVG